MLWVSIVVFVVIGVALIVWRKELTYWQSQMVWGATMHPGCAVVEGVLLILLALAFYLAHRAGLLGPGPLQGR